LIAAGAGKDAVTYRVFKAEKDNTTVEKIENVAFQDVDSILQSRAFGLISTYSPDAEIAMDAYLQLKNKPNKNADDEKKLKELQPIDGEEEIYLPSKIYDQFRITNKS
jgi:hypothetical protein